jgi:hypothetical protein
MGCIHIQTFTAIYYEVTANKWHGVAKRAKTADEGRG